ALAHAHQRGVVHRDLKPENILLADGVALVADFGIARSLVDTDAGAETRMATGIGAILGTPRYMSPEQASGGEVDERSDLYSLSCILYEMLAGEPPFSATNAAELMRQHLVHEPRPISERRPSVPPGVAYVIAKTLAKLPADRYPSATRFAEALATAIAAGPTPPSPSFSVPNNLPKPRTRFIGREAELRDCLRLLDETRMLTLTGIGGSGKTRLALRIAEQAIQSYPEGVCFVDLAPLPEPRLVLETVAAGFGVKEVADRSLSDVLVAHVRGKRLLLVLDNCEHVLGETAALADMLLSTADQLTILATSREGLGVEGERLVGLRSLSTPAHNDAKTVSEADAVKLFVDRARLASEDFQITAENAGGVAEICRRLDGIPLAIELAAARVRVLSVEQIRTKLDDRFRLLVGSGKSALPRHQTLRATFQWSYDQLTPDEQELFRALSVFAGGWTLESAARLRQADEMDLIDELGRLIDKSLVLVDRERAGDLGYRFLETVRQYAQERLVEAGESEDMHRRHFTVFLDLAEQAYAERFTREDVWGARLEADHDNLRSAIESVRDADAEKYLQLVGALAWFFGARSHFVEGREHLTRALAGAQQEPARSARARALLGLGHQVTWQGDAKAGRPWMEEALQTWRALGDRRETALALEGIGWAEMLGGRDADACQTFRESLALVRELGDRVLVNRAMSALGQALVALHRVEEAESVAREIIAFSSEHGDKRNEHLGWHYLADCALIRGDCEKSLGLYQQSLRLACAIEDRLEISFEMQGVAMSLAGLGRSEEALRLEAALQAERKRMGVDPHMRFWDELLERYFLPARAALGSESAGSAWETGERLSFPEAIELALKSQV
ncbi:MAG TPA: protein kinase, partial [Candidatus Eisenbacteria bacterium]|nr:protein kinase [Candidatus Eisenbacteria bacterium]